MNRLFGMCFVGLGVATTSQAQTATETVNLGTVMVEGSGDTLSIGIGFFQGGDPFVAWRFVSDFSQLNNADFPTSGSIRVGFRTPVGAPLSSLGVRALNRNGRPGSDVQGLTFAAPFDSNPLTSSSINFVISIGGPNDEAAVFAGATLEFFAASDVPQTPIVTGLLDASAPEIDVDLGFVALDGEAVEFAVDDQSGLWDDPTLVIYTNEGSPVTFVDEIGAFFELDVFNDPVGSVFTVSPDAVSVFSDGSVGFRRFGPGEYAVAVVNDLDDQDGPFGAEGDSTIPVDAIVSINNAVAVAPMDAINNDPNRVGWVTFAVGARAADFNSDGIADADDVGDVLAAVGAGVGDFDEDGSVDFFDVLAFLSLLDAS